MRNIDWFIILLGFVVSALGYFFLPTNWAWFILGFGVAHIVLGAIDLIFHGHDLREPG